MACCVIAAFLMGQLIALVRRWGIFFGVVTPNRYEDGGNTLLAWSRRRLANPTLRRGLGAALAIEIGVLGAWTYQAHGAHLYRLADENWSRLHGQRIVYVGICTPQSDDRYVRLVLDPPRRAQS